MSELPLLSYSLLPVVLAASLWGACGCSAEPASQISNVPATGGAASSTPGSGGAATASGGPGVSSPNGGNTGGVASSTGGASSGGHGATTGGNSATMGGAAASGNAGTPSGGTLGTGGSGNADAGGNANGGSVSATGGSASGAGGNASGGKAGGGKAGGSASTGGGGDAGSSASGAGSAGKASGGSSTGGGAGASTCNLPATVGFQKDVQPFLITACGGGNGCHVVDASSTMSSGGYNHAYDWLTGGAHTSSCPNGPMRFQIVMDVINSANPATCSKSRKMPPPDATGAGLRAPLTRCQIEALQAWLSEPLVTQTHRADDSSPTTPYPMPPFN